MKWHKRRMDLGRASGWMGLAVALAATGCVDNQEFLVITRAPAWEDTDIATDLVGGACAIDPANMVSLGRGNLDVGFGTAYHLPLAVENRLDASDLATGSDQSEVQLVDADVVLTLPQAPEIIEELRAIDETLVDFNYTLPSESLGESDQLGLSVRVISEWAANELRPRLVDGYGPDARLEVIASVVINGRRTGSGDRSDELASREFRFPIEICNKCLVDCSFCGAGCPVGSNASSSDTGPVQGDWVGGVCGSAQDFYRMVPFSCLESEEGQ